MADELNLEPVIKEIQDFFESNYRKNIYNLIQKYPKQKSLIVDYEDFEKFSPELADQLIEKPDMILKAAVSAILNMNLALRADIEFKPHVRFFNLPESGMLIESMGSKFLGKLINVKGVVTKRAEIKHRVKVAVYKCDICDAIYKIPLTSNVIAPTICEACKRKALQLIEEDSEFLDVQRAEVQELLERVKGGTPPARLELWMEDDLVNSTVPGNTVELTGILRLRPPTAFSKNAKSLIYTKYLDVIHVKGIQQDFEELEITEEDEEKIKEFSRDPKLFENIVKSIAPGIYGHKEIKQAISFQLFGGTKGKEMPGGAKIRDDIHILLIGDPGAAKCVSGDTEILLSDGSLKPIKEIVEEQLIKKSKKDKDGYYSVGNHDLLSLDLDGKINGSKATVFWKHKSPKYLYEITTASGRTLKITPEHPLFYSKNGYIDSKKAETIKKGEFIATPHYLPVNSKLQELPKIKGKINKLKLPKNISPNFARFLGYLIGDGYLRKTSSTYEFTFTNTDKELLDDFILISKSFNLNPKLSTTTEVPVVSVYSMELGRILNQMSMIKTSFFKIVPNEIMKSPDGIVKELIKSYFDCEAHVSKRGIVVCSASEKLLKQIQILLLRFKIISQLHETYSRATNSPTSKKTKFWRMSLYGENAKKYYEHIGFTSGIKNNKFNIKRKYNTNIDVIPNLHKLLKQIREQLFLTQFQCGISRSTYQHYEKADRNPSYNSLKLLYVCFRKRFEELNSISPKKFKNISELRKKLQISQREFAEVIGVSQTLISHVELGRVKNSSVYGKLDILFKKYKQNILEVEKNIRILELHTNSDIFWDKIVSKKRIKSKDKWVYDLQVDPVHNFVANGLIAHNSRLLQYVVELAPKSLYVSGKSVSGVGLTVSVEKDELSDGGWTLKAGALVLASGGIVGVDEFDKIDKDERSSLHEVMESGTISIAKAGIVARLKSKASILAAANPKYGRFDPNKLPAEQFNIPPTLLSRFDLIFPIMDILDETRDRELAEKILSTHKISADQTQDLLEGVFIEREFLKKYIAYARQHIRPVLTEEASDKIKDYYSKMRKMGKKTGAIPITPRQIEGLVRMAEASAKLRLSDKVLVKDAEESIGLMDWMMRKIGMDQETGVFDIDILATGKPKSQIDKIQIIMKIVEDLNKQEEMAEIKKIIERAKEHDIERDLAERLINELIYKGDLYKVKTGYVKIVEQF